MLIKDISLLQSNCILKGRDIIEGNRIVRVGLELHKDRAKMSSAAVAI
jgi:hypothetical protein